MSTKKRQQRNPRVGAFEPEGYLALGYVTQAHGLKGSVRVHLHNPDISTLLQLGEVQLVRFGSRKIETFKITDIREHPKGWLLDFEDCNDRNAAEALKRSALYVKHEDLPQLEEDEFYYHQLEGMSAFDTTGELLGTVTSVIEGPAYPILALTLELDGREVLIPLIDEFVPELNLSEKRLTIEVIDGLLD